MCVCLQRSRSAFSLTSDDSPEKGPEEEGAGAGGGGLQEYASLKREGKATSLPSWKSVDRLDNSSKYHTHTLFNVKQSSGTVRGVIKELSVFLSGLLQMGMSFTLHRD